MLVETKATPDFVLVDPVCLLPRYWATVWSLTTKGRSLARTTRKMLLRHIGSFYEFCDEHFGVDALDSSISERDAESFQEMVERFHVALTSESDYTTTTVQQWDAVRGFAKASAKRLAVKSDAWRAVSSLLDNMSPIRAPKRGRVRYVRALPASTLVDLLSVAEPGSARNPFLGATTQLRNWFIVNLLLLCGLRRGEALLLSIDALKQDIDPDTSELVHWLDVTTTGDEDDRATRPSIKTDQSHRQVPVSASLADLYGLYLSDGREPSEEHGFLLTARGGAPLSAESLNKVMRQLTAVLEAGPLKRFRERTGGKSNVSPHDLRHTCATARYSMFMATEPNRDLTLQRMRAFFGWSLTSDMPELYAHSAIQDDLLRSWNRLFDDRVHLLRSLEG